MTIHWPMPILLIALLMSGEGCAFPGRQTAQQSGKSPWNPFGTPKANYAQSDESEEEEEERPAKKITDPLTLKLTYAQWKEETGELPEAKLHYSEVLKEHPKNIQAILGLARTEYTSGNVVLAEQGFRRALKIDSGSAEAYSGLGQCQAENKQWTAAADSLTKASIGLPEDKTIRHELAIALVHTGDLPAAQLNFNQSVGAAAGHYNTALILKDDGHLPEAEEQLELALRKDPKLKEAERWLTEIRNSPQPCDSTGGDWPGGDPAAQ